MFHSTDRLSVWHCIVWVCGESSDLLPLSVRASLGNVSLVCKLSHWPLFSADWPVIVCWPSNNLTTTIVNCRWLIVSRWATRMSLFSRLTAVVVAAHLHCAYFPVLIHTGSVWSRRVVLGYNLIEVTLCAVGISLYTADGWAHLVIW